MPDQTSRAVTAAAQWSMEYGLPATALSSFYASSSLTLAASQCGVCSARPACTAMKFGIHNASWCDSPDPAEVFEAVKTKTQWAENLGFIWFSVMDHMIQIPGVGAPDEPVLEGWTALAGLAAVTRRIRLATLVTAVGYRNPAHLAKIAASVDLISRGRLTLGIGAGFFEDEYRQYGWEFPSQLDIRHSQ